MLTSRSVCLARAHAVLAAVACAAVLTTPAPAAASSVVGGRTLTFTSAGGVEERCIVLARMPGAVYRDSEVREEEGFCAIDFYAGTHALCSKLFSTSPGTLVHDLRRSAYAGAADRFERDVCPRGHVVAREAADVPVSWKMSVNTRESSATFSNSSLVYYHFARYFDAAIHVPPAVLRSMDRNAHQARVSAVGMLEKLRHYNALTYRRLMALERDFAQQGPLWTYTRATFGLGDAEFRQVAANVREAAAILRSSCSAGRLRFDVEPEALLAEGAARERTVDCGEG